MKTYNTKSIYLTMQDLNPYIKPMTITWTGSTTNGNIGYIPPQVEDEGERLRVQLAGCAVAASGNDLDTTYGDYGWSPAFEDVKALYNEKEKWRKAALQLTQIVKSLKK